MDAAKIVKILIPIDMTKASFDGIRSGLKMAEKHGASLHIVNFIQPHKKRCHYKEERRAELDFTLNLLMENQQKLSDFLETLPEHKIKIESKILVDELAQGVKKYIENNDIDILIAAVNGSHTVGDMFCESSKDTKIDVNCKVVISKETILLD